ncbi:MAG: CapA family protein, partial [Candidatus Aminicenantes bacterium]|nr:CapA family protein [Candidatus Aminicenantes bacterium]
MDSIVLIGDMLPDADGIRFDSRIIETCKNAAAVLINLEGAITDRPAVNGKKYGLLAPEHIIKQLKALCVNCVLLGNNHVMDAGEKGLADTIAVLQDNGISFAGVGMAGDKIYNELPFKTPNGEEYVIFS